MTFLEVLDDAVKIGFGSLTGWLIAKGTRSHEFEKERRRRKQDCLERVIEDLDEHESAFFDWRASNVAYREIKQRKEKDAPLEKQSLNDVNQNSDKIESARTKLFRSKSKLTVFGFDECAAALRAYNSHVLHFTVLVSAMNDTEKDSEEYISGHSELIQCAENLRVTVTKAFATL